MENRPCPLSPGPYLQEFELDRSLCSQECAHLWFYLRDLYKKKRHVLKSGTTNQTGQKVKKKRFITIRESPMPMQLYTLPYSLWPAGYA